MEDEAYCLMGLFDVNMPTIYGEGRKAFQRLQEEIMRRNPDTTLLAWGNICTIDEPVDSVQSRCALFARSPADFRGCGSLIERSDDPTRGTAIEVCYNHLNILCPLLILPLCY